MKRKVLPAASVPEEGYDLLAEYAHDKRLTLSEAIRSLLQQSPELNEFAAARTIEVNFEVNAWGGSKRQEAS